MSASSPGAIDIRFVSSKKEKQNGAATYTDQSDKESSWYTHPAFTFGDKELSGFWIGKFETSGTKDNPMILPNQISLKGGGSTIFKTSQNFNSYITTGDSHMAKNSEWGAVAYLSQSKYGKYGKDGEEVYINNCNKYITGIAGSTVNAASDSTCSNTYEKEAGWKASTTGTIYGVYDMSGGAWEYVMGYLTTSSETSGTISSSNYAGFETKPDSKYVDEYTGTSAATACGGSVCYGHALSETSGWYSSSANYFQHSYPCLLRTGVCGYSNTQG